MKTHKQNSSSISTTDKIFFNEQGLDRDNTEHLVAESLRGMDDGELFLEYRANESFVRDDGCLKSASRSSALGFGLRAVSGEAVGYAQSTVLSDKSLKRAVQSVRAIRHHGRGDSGSEAVMAAAPIGTNKQLYSDINPMEGVSFESKTALLEEIDAWVRACDPRVHQVSVSLTGSWQVVRIIGVDGRSIADVRPLTRLNISVVTRRGDRLESGSAGIGGRFEYARLIAQQSWQSLAAEALRKSIVNLDAVDAPAGEMTVVLGAGWPAVMLHEAIGHGLEGDFNRKATSAFSGLMGQRVAAPGVTVVDDGTLSELRGSITVDDEGTPSQCTTLIEDGILVGYMQDRLNARLMGVKSTGNGRRESFASPPLPRMTNTIMLNGKHTHDEIISSVSRGIYAADFGGGQVDITSGKFVFSATEAYEIVDGKIGRPLRGASLVGTGFDALTRISMVGNNMRLDGGIGTCGKSGQSVPVGVGQPTLRLDNMTVGGSQI